MREVKILATTRRAQNHDVRGMLLRGVKYGTRQVKLRYTIISVVLYGVEPDQKPSWTAVKSVKSMPATPAQRMRLPRAADSHEYGRCCSAGFQAAATCRPARAWA